MCSFIDQKFGSGSVPNYVTIRPCPTLCLQSSGVYKQTSADFPVMDFVHLK